MVMLRLISEPRWVDGNSIGWMVLTGTGASKLTAVVVRAEAEDKTPRRAAVAMAVWIFMVGIPGTEYFGGWTLRRLPG
jgi:hypothetical protein